MDNKKKWFEGWYYLMKPHAKFKHRKIRLQNGTYLHLTEGDKRSDGRLIIKLPYGHGKKVYSYRVTASNNKMLNELMGIMMSCFDQMQKDNVE